MSSDDTMKVLERHGAAVRTNDLEAVMADDAHDAVLISPRHGVLRGAEIRSFFEHPSDLTGFKVISLFVDDDVAFFTWKTDAVAFGSDTFVCVAARSWCRPWQCQPPDTAGPWSARARAPVLRPSVGRRAQGCSGREIAYSRGR